MADERVGLLRRAVASSACGMGVAMKERKPTPADVDALMRLASQCIELAGTIDPERGADWLPLAVQVSDLARVAQPEAEHRRKSVA